MKPSACAYFPFTSDNENNCLKRSTTVEQAITSSIRIFCSTKKGSRLGNKIGSFIPELKHQLIKTSDLPKLAEEARRELNDQFPGVNFLNVEFSKDFQTNSSVLSIKIDLSIGTKDTITQLIITLPSIFDLN